MKKYVNNILKKFSKKAHRVDINDIGSCDELTHDCIQQLGVDDEELEDQMFAVIFNYIFGLENSVEDFNLIYEDYLEGGTLCTARKEALC